MAPIQVDQDQWKEVKITVITQFVTRCRDTYGGCRVVFSRAALNDKPVLWICLLSLLVHMRNININLHKNVNNIMKMLSPARGLLLLRSTAAAAAIGRCQVMQNILLYFGGGYLVVGFNPTHEISQAFA